MQVGPEKNKKLHFLPAKNSSHTQTFKYATGATCFRYVLMDCEAFQNVRKDILETARKGRDVTVKRLIGEGGVVGNVIAYLRETAIYSKTRMYNQPLTLCWGSHYYRY